MCRFVPSTALLPDRVFEVSLFKGSILRTLFGRFSGLEEKDKSMTAVKSLSSRRGEEVNSRPDTGAVLAGRFIVVLLKGDEDGVGGGANDLIEGAVADMASIFAVEHIC